MTSQNCFDVTQTSIHKLRNALFPASNPPFPPQRWLDTRFDALLNNKHKGWKKVHSLSSRPIVFFYVQRIDFAFVPNLMKVKARVAWSKDVLQTYNLLANVIEKKCKQIYSMQVAKGISMQNFIAESTSALVFTVHVWEKEEWWRQKGRIFHWQVSRSNTLFLKP